MVATKRIRLQKSAQECLKHCSSDNTRLPVKEFTKVVDPKLLEKAKQKHKTKTLREPKLPSSEIFTKEELRHCKDQYDEIQKRKKQRAKGKDTKRKKITVAQTAGVDSDTDKNNDTSGSSALYEDSGIESAESECSQGESESDDEESD